MRVHDHRHSRVTPAKVVQEQLVHASIGLTMNTYSHVVPAMMQDARDGDGSRPSDAAVGRGVPPNGAWLAGAAVSRAPTVVFEKPCRLMQLELEQVLSCYSVVSGRAEAGARLCHGRSTA
jgi:hypothetical protein